MTRIAPVLAALAALIAPAGALAASPQVATSITPQPSRFGDVIHATITVRADAAAQVQAGFSPFRVLRSTSTTARKGGAVVTTWTFDLQCLEARCVPGPGRRMVPVATSVVHVGSATVAARFRPASIAPRATEKQVANPTRSFLHPLTPGPPSYRFSPTALRTTLFAAAAVLVLVAVALLLPLARPRRSARRADTDALARALRLVQASLSRPPADRRRALGLLARTLSRRGEPQVARTAADLAWSEPEPDTARMRQLVDRLRGAG